MSQVADYGLTYQRINRVSQEGSYAEVTVKLGLVVLFKKTFDVCEEA